MLFETLRSILTGRYSTTTVSRGAEEALGKAVRTLEGGRQGIFQFLRQLLLSRRSIAVDDNRFALVDPHQDAERPLVHVVDLADAHLASLVQNVGRGPFGVEVVAGNRLLDLMGPDLASFGSKRRFLILCRVRD